MALKHRVRQLEKRRANAPPAPCRVCGGDDPSRNYRLEFSKPGEEPKDERCPACGRQTVLRLEFDRLG